MKRTSGGVRLKKCPFCAASARIVIRGSYFHGFCDYRDCFTHGPLCATETEAIAAWNRRAG